MMRNFLFSENEIEDSEQMDESFCEDSQFSYPVYPINFY